MTFPFENRIKACSYLFLWLIYALFHVLSMWQIVPIPFWALIVDGLTHAVLFGIMGILLWNVIQYGNYDSLSLPQRLINYSALAILFISLGIGCGFFLDYLFLGEMFALQFIPTLFLRSFMGLMLYLILILSSRNNVLKIEKEQPEEDLGSELDASQEKVDVQELAEKESLDRIAVKVGQKIHVVLVSEILYLQSYGDYVQIITEKEKLIKEQTMKYFELHLPSNRFVRVHRSYIINVEKISRIELYAKQSQRITLHNGDQLKVSAAGYKTLRAALDL